MALPAPVKISPLIKFGRYTMLTLGILYGSSRQKLNQAKEDAFRAKEEEERPAREAAMKAAKEKASREEMAYLAQQAGVPSDGAGGGGRKDGKGGSGGGDPLKSCGCDKF